MVYLIILPREGNRPNEVTIVCQQFAQSKAQSIRTVHRSIRDKSSQPILRHFKCNSISIKLKDEQKRNDDTQPAFGHCNCFSG